MDKAKNSTQSEVLDSDKYKREVTSKIENGVAYFQKKRQFYQKRYQFYKYLKLIIRVIVLLGQHVSMVFAGGAALWMAHEHLKVVVPIVSFAGALLYMLREISVKAGLARAIRKYQALIAQSMLCEEELIGFHIDMMHNNENNYQEVLGNLEKLEIELRLKSSKLKMQLDTKILQDNKGNLYTDNITMQMSNNKKRARLENKGALQMKDSKLPLIS